MVNLNLGTGLIGILILGVICIFTYFVILNPTTDIVSDILNRASKKGYDIKTLWRYKDMDFKTRQIINSLVNDILSIYDIHIPLKDIKDLEDLISRLGGKLIEGKGNTLSTEDSYVKKVNDRFIISISPNIKDERIKRIYIGQSLGYLFIRLGYMINTEIWNSYKDGEIYKPQSLEDIIQGQEFAFALLMPEQEYVKIMNANTDGATVCTKNIATYFNVPLDIASIRGKRLGYLRY